MKNLDNMDKQELVDFSKATLKYYYVLDVCILLLAVFNVVAYFVKIDVMIYSLIIDAIFVIDCIVFALVRKKLNKNK